MRKLFFVAVVVALLLGAFALVAFAGNLSGNSLQAATSVQTDAAVASTTALDAILADSPEGAMISATHIGSACERDSGGGY
ncbi:MAG: hypothetical protein HY327_03965 [Chloroflexi bacterium]|nr:hypothetical protein [Chloroflexota bacterium]